MKYIKMAFVLMVFMISSCVKQLSYKDILKNCSRSSQEIDAISKRGIELCESQISGKNATPKTFKPDYFTQEQLKLPHLIGAMVHYVSFYSVNNEFKGMCISVSDKEFIYRGVDIPNEVNISGRVSKKIIEKNGFSIYLFGQNDSERVLQMKAD